MWELLLKPDTQASRVDSQVGFVEPAQLHEYHHNPKNHVQIIRSQMPLDIELKRAWT
jgi:hypothetical protein